ncbi:hypothetical protein MJ1_0029 [Nanobdella aerobiophila]|uniref:Uncharacterized protein n=1 Tax=Nanobdella aerobiophila TaxID=2586965 RepID=A0A915SCA0_9ARCH|nr:hypothetical protein [Nanobdella aerobiophila]BBL45208.1 hypothetical protein MJ1_0029 [Nanobdella aerobiophila]
MRKGQSMPINTIIIIIIALIVLVLIILFFSGSFGNGVRSTSSIGNAAANQTNQVVGVVNNLSNLT